MVEVPRPQLARALYELFNERDVDGLMDLAAPDIEWDWSRSLGPDNGLFNGKPAVARFLRSSWEHWETIEMTPEAVFESGDEVLVLVHVRLRGRDGIEVEARGPHVQTWNEDGKLSRYRLFQDEQEARAEVGLERRK